MGISTAWRRALALVLCGLAVGAMASPSDPLRIGSKRFTESFILGELLTQAAAPYARAEHRQGLGNTAVVLAALGSGAIDLYPEYLGTIERDILKHDRAVPLAQIERELAALGLGVGVPLGFNNSYALAMRGGPDGLRRLGELAAHPQLRFGLSQEFIGRGDGWPGLARRYGLTQQPRGLDHGLAYAALMQGQVDVIDIYSTDARIAQLGLRVLDDELAYFPRYDAMLLYRLDVARRFPAAWQALRGLQGSIRAADMIAMNAAVEIDGQRFASVAARWLAARRASPSASASASPSVTAPAAAPRSPVAGAVAASLPWSDLASASSGAADDKDAAHAGGSRGLWHKLFDDRLWLLTRQHVALVASAVLLACAAGIPLGVLAACAPRLRQTVLALAGVLQTVPSLALLAMLIPLLGRIGTAPALVALVVYALLPIVRNTCLGIVQLPAGLRQAALALGLNWRDRLLRVELPLALPVILAGVKTAAVMSVGTATIAAFIGAGGYGERITIGLALNDNVMLLAGAIPAALLALLTQGLFELLERAATRGRPPSE